LKKDVIISIKGIYKTEGDKDVVELMTQGTYSRKDGCYYLQYQESEATGMDGVTTTLKIIDDSLVSLSRSGMQGTQLMVEKGKRHLCHYDTGYGNLMVGVNAAKIESSLNDEGGDLHFKYSLDINSSLASENEVFINIKECKR